MRRFLTRAALVLCVGIALVATATAQSRAPAGPAVAVLPFANLSGVAVDDWISQGLAETVTADLEQLETVAVITAPSASADAGGADSSLRRVGDELGVGWLVTGAFQRIGDRVRVTARLFDVERGRTRLSVTLDGTAGDIFALQDRVVAELAGDGSVFATPPPAAAPAPGVAHAEGVIVPTAPRQNGNGNGWTTAPAPAPAMRNAGPDRLRIDQSMSAGGAGFGALAGRPRIAATRTDTPPDIDGRLDDAVWRTAAMLSEFVQQSPLDGAPATEETEVYIAYDDDHLYFGFYLHYSDPSIMRANRVDRDRSFSDDLMTVYLDTFMDQQRSYDFDLNAYNVQGDGIINSGGARGGDGGRNPIPFADRSWDTLFHSGAEIVEDGYTAEMAIPFKSIRYPQQASGVPHRWGFQIVREIRGKDGENVVWAPMSRDVAGFMQQFGVLEGMTDLSTSRNLEILPQLTAIQFGSLNDTGNFVNQGTSPEAGVNVKYGITSNLTADFTANPDFSQIESDRPQIAVNQRFPLFFSELRPFFLEGAEIFHFTSPVNLVHTRTIVDPNFGGKLTGKVGDTTLGFLVTDDAAPGKRDDPADPGLGQNAQVVIGRARYDLYSESHIGAIVTDREFLDGYSRVGGLDAQFRLGRTSRFNFVAVQSQHRDEAGNERSGPMLGALMQHNGRNLSASTFFGRTDPDFRTEVGFVRRVDQQLARANVGYRWWPEHWIINWGPRVNYSLNYNHAGIREDEMVGGGMNFNFAKNLGLGLRANRALERFGGIDFRKTTYNLFANTNTSRLFSVGGGFTWGDEIFYDADNPYLGRAASARLFANVRPMSRFTSQINVNTSRFNDVRAGDVEVFDVKIFRALSTFTFTERLLLRNISEYNSFSKTFGQNWLVTYRINALTVFYIGYDDHYQQADLIPDLMDDEFFPPTAFRRTNRAFFTKLQYLFRY